MARVGSQVSLLADAAAGAAAAGAVSIFCSWAEVTVEAASSIWGQLSWAETSGEMRAILLIRWDC